MVVNAHLCAWTKLASHLVEWFVGQRRWRYHTVSQRERWEKSWLTMRGMCPKRTVNLWIYYRCVTHREKNLTIWSAHEGCCSLLVHFLRQTVQCLWCVTNMWALHFDQCFKFSQKLYWNHHGFPLWRFCFSNIISVPFIMLLGFVLFELETCALTGNSRWWKIRWKFSTYDQVSATSCWRNKTVVMWLSLCILPPASIFALWCRNHFSKFSVLFSSEN